VWDNMEEKRSSFYTRKVKNQLTFSAPEISPNSMNANLVAELGSPQMRQSSTRPQSMKKLASSASVTCRQGESL